MHRNAFRWSRAKSDGRGTRTRGGYIGRDQRGVRRCGAADGHGSCHRSGVASSASGRRSCTSSCERPHRMNLANRIEILQGDLTEMNTDAIVNAANNDLQLGGGVAGAIRRKGGPKIQAECDEIGTIPVGGAAITSGGNLKARFVIHAASMELGGKTSAHALRSSTAHALRIAAQNGLRSIAF